MSYFANSDQLPDWVRHAPDSWKKDWLKWHVSLSTERPDEEQRATLPYLSNEDIASWTGKLLHEELQPYEADSRLFQAGDVLFNKLRPYLAKVFHADFNGTSSGELLCLRPSKRVDARYLFYVLTSFGFIDSVDSHTFGSKMPRADWETVGHHPLPLPDIEDQKRIARFLDEKTAQIDGLIEKKRALLDRLAEKRQAIITHAVTKGLNPDVPMKPSGIDWLGDIPAHWSRQRLRFSVDKIEQGWSPQCENRPADRGEWGVLKVGCVNGEHYDESENKALPADLEPITRYEVRVGDLLVSRANTKELLGSAAIVEETQGNIIFCDKLYRLDVSNSLDRRYLTAFLRSPLARFQYECEATGTSGSMQNIGQDTLKNLCHPLPPIAEQQSIGKWIWAVMQDFSSTAIVVSQAIEKLIEYRSALITAAVTGQLPELNG
ncbi:restriction endonuclease subunit S [Pollutimonas bauzanensis]|uniref:Type I restriction enzyme, S subunit n=1 Tax=Pollutimonas bauzanensis TaxID=658167 RepID=A0A1M5VHY0_9BURK|nr:restriction endonuclease subunit S [Pollutimonas bauzanensis]SHH74788.1 type I restriction enzyme, S subunit [Pollutimonas bauzanensis]